MVLILPKYFIILACHWGDKPESFNASFSVWLKLSILALYSFRFIFPSLIPCFNPLAKATNCFLINSVFFIVIFSLPNIASYIRFISVLSVMSISLPFMPLYISVSHSLNFSNTLFNAAIGDLPSAKYLSNPLAKYSLVSVVHPSVPAFFIITALSPSVK